MTTATKTREMALMGVMTAVISILGPLSIPIGIVPISLQNFAIYIAFYALGMKRGTISTLTYILLGAVGLPVFAGYSAGFSKLFGPTGGYLIGFVFMAIIAGYFIDSYSDKWYMCFLGMVLGTAVCYGFGTAWLAYQANMSAGAALAAGVIPFMPGDLLKIVISTAIGPKIRNSLIRTNLFYV